MRIAFATLGCKVNQDETAGLKELFAQAGHQVVDFRQQAEVYIVNTCTVTHLGSRKSRQLLRQARRTNPGALVVAVGCYPQADARELEEMVEVDLIIGNSHKSQVVGLVEGAVAGKLGDRTIVEETDCFQELPAAPASGRHRATLKIQEGCQRFCTYCIVPKARGRLRSMTVEAIVAKAAELADLGYREIVLTGINLTSYGKERGEKSGLAQVVRALTARELPVRIRLSSVEPTDFDQQLIAAIKAAPNVCRHFHIPLQSGSDGVLRRMGRNYTSGQYIALVEDLKREFDNPSFSTDIIVGFPGEDEADFADTCQVVRQTGYCKIHVFRFSPRPGTPAAGYPDQVAPAVAAARSQQLISLGEEVAARYARSLAGQQEQVLVEGESDLLPGGVVGYGNRYVRIHCPQGGEPGQLLPVKITGQAADELIAAKV